MDIHTLKECISKADDPRRTSHGHVLHRFEDIIIIGLCTVVSEGEDFADMEMFGREREDWLRRFLESPNGIPDADTFRRVFEAVDPVPNTEHTTSSAHSRRRTGSFRRRSALRRNLTKSRPSRNCWT